MKEVATVAHWVSLEDEMPPAGHQVLISTRRAGALVDTWLGPNAGWELHSWAGITHWAPMPQGHVEAWWNRR